MDVFNTVAGHEEIRRHLASAMEGGTVSHAYLFEGIDGVGKTTMAMEFVQALLCTEPQVSHMACGHCLSCRTVKTGNHPDVKVLTKGDKASLGIGEVRSRLVYDAQIKPYQSAWKVYIIQDADTMTVEAQNALLKTLEEPPSYVLIILLANNSQKFLPTILSRVITLHFQPLPERTIASWLKDHQGLTEERASLFAGLSRGSLGTAIMLASSETFGQMREELTGHLESLRTSKPSEILKMADFFNKYKDSQDMIFSLMQVWFRDLLILILEKDEQAVLTKDKTDILKKLALEYDADEVMRLFSSVERIREALRLGAQYAFSIDCLLKSMMEEL